MSNPTKRRPRWFFPTVGVVAVLAAGGLLYARQWAGGFRNLASPQFWVDRSSGDDIYNAHLNYLQRGNRDLKEVCLTIDDGPHPESAELLLDALKKYNVHATFFVVGKMVKLHPGVVQRMIEEGNEVGNHTQDHIRLDTLNEKQVRAELDNCETNVERATGHTMKLMRPPGMHFNSTILKVAQEKGYTTIGWNVGAHDFIPALTPEEKLKPENQALINLKPEEIVERVMRNVRPGSIILLHDSPITAKALPMVLEKLQAAGYKFVSSAEMLSHIPEHLTVEANPIAPNRVANHVEPASTATSKVH